MKLNEEEKKIIETYEKGRIKTKKPSKDESTNIKAIAKNTFKKDPPRSNDLRWRGLILVNKDW